MAIQVLLEDEELAIRTLTGPIAQMFEMELEGETDFERAANVLRAVWQVRGMEISVSQLSDVETRVATSL